MKKKSMRTAIIVSVFFLMMCMLSACNDGSMVPLDKPGDLVESSSITEKTEKEESEKNESSESSTIVNDSEKVEESIDSSSQEKTEKEESYPESSQGTSEYTEQTGNQEYEESYSNPVTEESSVVTDQEQSEVTVQQEESSEPHKHEYVLLDSSVVEPTCKGDGEITYICVCGDSYTESVPAFGHSMGEEVDVFGDGLTFRSVCETCGAFILRNAETTQVERGWVACECNRFDMKGDCERMWFDSYTQAQNYFNNNQTMPCGHLHSHYGSTQDTNVVGWSYTFSDNY